MTWADLNDSVAAIASVWRDDRAERQKRRHLDPVDFGQLSDAGFLRAPVPEDMGGLWRSLPESTGPLAEVLRTLARADPSVALVSSMHPSVVGFWLATTTGPSAWTEQRDAVFASARDGAQWGTITSEPGSGGDIGRTKAVAVHDPSVPTFVPGVAALVSGDKHFGSGSGICDHMMTSARAEGEEPMIYVFDARGRPWDGSDGLRLLAEWDGVGMKATQSHAMRLQDCPAVRLAWDGPLSDITLAAGPMVAALFTAVILGVFDEAIATARAQIAGKADTLRAYEQVEWAQAEMDHWLAVQAYEGALRTIESGDHGRSLHAAVRAKQSVANLAESSLSRLARVIGGGTYSGRSPFSAWFEDVRALGFLRPPWGLAYDSLFLTSLG